MKLDISISIFLLTRTILSKGSWEIVIKNIEELSKLTYITVGVVLTEENVDKCVDTIRFAHKLGVADIRIIGAAQIIGLKIPKLNEIEQEILDVHPILNFRIKNYINGKSIRGLTEKDNNKCPLVIDDSIIANNEHYPCVIYFREGGKAIGKVGPNMRQERYEWYKNHDTYKDDICRNQCLDVCSQYSNSVKKLRTDL